MVGDASSGDEHAGMSRSSGRRIGLNLPGLTRHGAVVSFGLLLLVACQRAPAGEGGNLETERWPIVGGQADYGHPAVGIVQSEGTICTGTLISPRIVVTAAHCMAPGYSPKWFHLGSDLSSPDESFAVEKAIPHPQYGDMILDGAEVAIHDIAILVLDGPAGVAPMKVRTSSLAGLEGASITFVGFGKTDAEDDESSGSKMKVQTTIGAVEAQGFWNYTQPSNPKNTCGGDSGGPALLVEAGAEQIVGLVSSGDAECLEDGWNTRADIHADWLQGLVDTYDPGTVEPECGNGFCESGESLQSCPQDCEESGGGLGAPCETGEDCKSELVCVDSPAAAFCTPLCDDPEAGSGCPDGYACVPLAAPPPTGEGVCYPDGEPSPDCGNGSCDPGEDPGSCAEDCTGGACGGIDFAGCCDGELLIWCEDGELRMMHCGGAPACGWNSEDQYYDCGTAGGEEPSGTYPLICGETPAPVCGNGICEPGESPADCPGDCPEQGPCGDGECGPGESFGDCPEDCILPGCGAIGFEGCCDGELLRWCQDGELYQAHCAGSPSCGWSEEGYYDCSTAGEADPSEANPKDCSAQPSRPGCGDGDCQTGETPVSCPADCSPTPVGPGCGNGYCEHGETPSLCAADCNAEHPPVCGNGWCEVGEDDSDCRQDCGQSICGNTACEAGESAVTCPADCEAASTCGDGNCTGGETAATCAADCAPQGESCGDGICQLAEGCKTCPDDCGSCLDSGDGAGCSAGARPGRATLPATLLLLLLVVLLLDVRFRMTYISIVVCTSRGAFHAYETDATIGRGADPEGEALLGGGREIRIPTRRRLFRPSRGET
jgi:hypothetical protein